MAIAAGCVQSRGLAGAFVAVVAVSAGSDFVSTNGPLGVCACEAAGIAIVAAVATVAVPRKPRRVGPDRSCDIACSLYLKPSPDCARSGPGCPCRQTTW